MEDPSETPAGIAPPRDRRALPRRVRAATDQALSPGRYPLPPEVSRAAVDRLAAIALAYSIACAAVYLIGSQLHLGWIDPERAPASYSASLILAVISGLLMAFIATWRRRAELAPAATLRAAMVFQVGGGLLIALAENATPRAVTEIIRGQSSLALWITIFVLAVPTSFYRGLAAALATASMGPLAHATQVLAGNVASPPPLIWLILHGPAFPIGIGAAFLSRYIYRLGAQVTHARELGSYELVEAIGSGGMGEVWRARHRMLARTAAIKLIRADALMSKSPERIDALARRFEREARATATLHSPHTVSIYDYGVTEGGEFYYVMELLDGVHLEDLVNLYGPPPVGRTLCILVQVCSSLAEAHGHGIVHRDIKPRNILLCRLGASYDFAKVLDFGLAKFLQEADSEPSHLTREGEVVGTPAFMAPELATGEAGGNELSDIYALGCVAYWLLTGQTVFQARNSMAMAVAHLRDSPEPPSRRSELEIAPELDELVLACLAKVPGERPSPVRHIAARFAAMRGAYRWTETDAEQWWSTHAPQATEVAVPSLADDSQPTR